MKYYTFLIICITLISIKMTAQDEIIPLWNKNLPNYKNTNEIEKVENDDIIWISNVQEPNIAVYLASKKNKSGQAVIICPGGGYEGLAYDIEGIDIAKWLNSKGITAFVLKYRLPVSKSNINGTLSPLMDAKRAIRQVRYYSEKWGIDKHKIGIMGFSAGGHLASTLGTHFYSDSEKVNDDIDSISARPDFMALIYPVITMKENLTHMGSRNALLGKNPDKKLIDFYSNELQVKEDTPPCFLVHATDDDVVPVENSLNFYQALKNNKIAVEMHLYPKGGHGFSLALKNGYLQTWTDRFCDWINGLENMKLK